MCISHWQHYEFKGDRIIENDHGVDEMAAFLRTLSLNEASRLVAKLTQVEAVMQNSDWECASLLIYIYISVCVFVCLFVC